ncbi:MAG TPA: TrmH family RNA methyltransferase [Pirellulales bacterium]
MSNPAFEHQRHQPLTPLERPRELAIACAPLRSNINLSRIVRAAGCCGITRLLCCGTAKVIERIARDGAQSVGIEVHRTLPHPLAALAREGYRIVGLEQTSGAKSLYEYRFPRKSVLVVGNERTGLEDDVLQLLHDAVEIPIYGMPYSHNVATATAMALYEYCRQFPTG